MGIFLGIEGISTSEIVEKKSRFICNVIEVKNKEEAEDNIKQFKKKYHDARHNCYAYRVLEDNGIIEKSSDDGEPSGTAGAPIITILQKNNLCNVLVVVTRYFGGILLGTGGLVRCYSDSTIKAIEASNKIILQQGIEKQIILEYNSFENFKYYCKKNDINILETSYLEQIKCKIEIDFEKKEKFNYDVQNKKIDILQEQTISVKYIRKKVTK